MPGIRIAEALDVGQNNEKIGLNEVCDQGGQIVVVSKLDLINDNRIVLIDDRDDPEPKERQEGVARVQKSSPMT